MARTAFQVNGERKVFSGRTAWALERLIEAGFEGVTTAQLPPGARWSAYVQKLRRQGIPVAMVRERHTGDFPGQHGKYLLQCHAAVMPPESRSR
jgi:hypothetical protein